MNREELREIQLAFRVAGTIAPQTGFLLPCWLAAHDDTGGRCEGRLEAFHFIGRQRIRNTLGARLPRHTIEAAGYNVERLAEWGPFEWNPDDVIAAAEWDPRNAGPACELHHRRLDSHAMPPLVIDREQLPARVDAFARDWGIESELERKYPALSRAGDI